MVSFNAFSFQHISATRPTETITAAAGSCRKKALLVGVQANEKKEALGSTFKCNPSQFHHNTYRKHYQAGPYFRRQVHKHAAQHHQKNGQNTPRTPLPQHA
jgi:hypothetical protein